MNSVKFSSKNVTLRHRRQMTLPADVCEFLGIREGDQMELVVEEEGRLLLIPRKTLAIASLQEIQQVFAVSGISEEEVQQAGKQARKHLFQNKYDRG